MASASGNVCVCMLCVCMYDMLCYAILSYCLTVFLLCHTLLLSFSNASACVARIYTLEDPEIRDFSFYTTPGTILLYKNHLFYTKISIKPTYSIRDFSFCTTPDVEKMPLFLVDLLAVLSSYNRYVSQ
jgi:hypothetical protein